MTERHRILIVDDNALDRQAVVLALRREAAEIDGVEADVVEADTIARAREALQREEFACVFLDHGLPDGTALDLLLEVRAQGLATPIVVLTGQRDERIMVEVMQAGAVDYLPKERLQSELVARSLRAALRFRQAQREKQAALDELRARDRAIAAATNGIVLADPRRPDCPLIYANAAFLRMTGYTEEETLGRNCRFLQGPDTDPEAVRALREAVRDERACQTAILNYRKDGTPFWNEVTVSPVRDANGNLTHFVGIQTDVTARHDADEVRRRAEAERRAAERALQEAHGRTASLLESITDAFFALDADWRFTYVNTQAERLLARRQDVLLGRRVWDEFPETVGSTFERQYRRAVEQGTAVSFEEFFPPLGAWFEVRVYPSEGGLSIFFQDVTARWRAEDALRRSREDLRLAVDAARLGTFYCDYPLDKIIWNQTCKEHFFLPPDAEVDIALFYSLLHPDDREQTRRAIERAEAECAMYDVEYRTLAPDGRTRWVNAVGRFYYDADGHPTRFDGVTLDISARKQAEEALRRGAARERFLAELAGRAQAMPDPDAVIADALRSLGEFLGASRCVFADIDVAADTCTIPVDYCAGGVASMVGTFPISDFGAYLVAEYRAGRTVTADDVRGDPARFPPGIVAAYDAVGCRAFIAAPVMHSARLVSVLAVHSPVPRHWHPEEVALVRAVVERTWLTVEVLRQQRALAREAQEQRGRAEREALLNRIGAAIRHAADPDRVLETAVRAVGEALGADRSYYSAYDQDADTATLGPEWHRAGLPDIAGPYRMSRFTVNRDPAYQAGGTQAIQDTAGDPALQALDIRALVRVPLVSGTAMTALAVAMAHGPRAWTADEVALVEAVATQTQTAIEAARVQRREHTIATQLQEALLPAIPPRVPGLRLGHHYRAALQEAGIGGDFAQVFSDDKGVSHLVVGDLAGKGLAAAGQIATVTNMLRFAVLNGRSLAGPLMSLNATLADGGLLSGFATLFVGRYDAGARTLTYVNCGQDAGLVLRGSGGMDTLPPTGPVLGAFSGVTYTEGTVTLEPGDVLALYTDGLTEAGPSRTALLTGDGVADLLRGLRGVMDPQAVADALVAGVDAYAGQEPQDDQCLLVAVATEAGRP